jgi:hypothetical protein
VGDVTYWDLALETVSILVWPALVLFIVFTLKPPRWWLAWRVHRITAKANRRLRNPGGAA